MAELLTAHRFRQWLSFFMHRPGKVCNKALIKNPAVKTYAKITQQANATAGKLLKLYQQVKK